MIQTTSTGRYDGIRIKLIHRRRRRHIHHNSKIKPKDANNHHSHVFESKTISHKPVLFISPKMINSVTKEDDNTCPTTATSFQRNKIIPQEEISSSSESFNKKSDDLMNNIKYKQLKQENKPKIYNSFCKYVLKILYGILSILLLTALIVPSILAYLLAPKSSQTGLSELSTYRNHCAGISPRTLWQMNTTTTITMILNTTQCNFPNNPLYFVSMAGVGSHFCLTGYGAIYLLTNESFQIYTQYICSPMNSTVLLSMAQARAYDVNWIGFYK